MNILNGLISVAILLTSVTVLGGFVLIIGAASVYFGPLGYLGILISALCVLAFLIGALS